MNGYMKLAHISEESATQTIVTLHNMGVVAIEYPDGQCLIVGT